MHATIRSAVLAVAVLICASCGRATIDPSASLVGAQALPARSVLEKEVISINRKVYGDAYPAFHILSYELRPDGELVVAHILSAFPANKEFGEERLRLSAEIAAAARQKLWRLRPGALNYQGHKDVTRPRNCVPQGSHDSPDLNIAFVDEGKAAGGTDDRLALVGLPAVRSCDNANARSARRLVAEVLASFPSSRVASRFEQMVAD